jgi:transposase
VLLFEDETILRLFPVLRRAWSLRGEQATVAVTGLNAKRVLFGAINLRTGHRTVMCQPKMTQQGFQTFLRQLHRCYPGRPIWLLLDGSSAHKAPKSRALAELLHIELVWLPKQCPELNAVDHLFKEVKANISANHQYHTIDQHAACAEAYILHLTNKQALGKAGVLSTNFWLKAFFKELLQTHLVGTLWNRDLSQIFKSVVIKQLLSTIRGDYSLFCKAGSKY